MALAAAEAYMRLQPLLRAARRLAAARPEARSFAARAWLGAPLVRASLALVGLRSTLRWVEAAPVRRASRRRGARPVGVDEGRALVQGAFRAHLVGGECLDQSMVQYLLHRRDGLAVRLVVGVKRAVTGHTHPFPMGETRKPPPQASEAPAPPAQPVTAHTPRPDAAVPLAAEIAAHAWVEGGPEGGPPDDPTFVPLFVGGAENRGR